MYYRKIQDDLKIWKIKKDRKPLIIRGARQVGKTTVVNLFAEEFDNFIPLNLELFEDREIFKKEYSIDEIISAIQILKGKNISSGKTLIFIDEIQNSAIAVKMLRYFYEKRPDLFIIAAGSLLEIFLERDEISFPVGRIEFLYMYPFNFYEFLDAKNEKQILNLILKGNVPDFIHHTLMKYFLNFSMIGGMPEIIQTFLETSDINSLKSIYESLFVSYTTDAEKYARNQTMKQILRHCLSSICQETGKRIKFQNFGNSNYRSREVGEALKTIEKAMLINLVYPVINSDLPLVFDYKRAPKLHFLDIGLINYFAGIQSEYIKQEDLNSVFKGIAAEQIVRQELIASDYTTNFVPPIWTREKKYSNAEVDLVLQIDNLVIPIEVKSGATGSLRSLHQFLDESKIDFAVRIYSDKMKIEDAKTPEGKKYRLLNVPHYLTGNLRKLIKQYI